MKVLVCPEDATQMAIGKEMLVDPLPEDVKAKVVWRDNYWLTDEALSTYVRSAGLFGMEMHSPIMCIGNGIPADRLPLRGADEQRLHVARHRPGRLALRPRRGEGRHATSRTPSSPSPPIRRGASEGRPGDGVRPAEATRDHGRAGERSGG